MVMSPGSFLSDHQRGGEYQIPYADSHLQMEKSTWSWDFRRMCDWAYSRWNVWVFAYMFAFRVKSSCFHHTKLTIIYANLLAPAMSWEPRT